MTIENIEEKAIRVHGAFQGFVVGGLINYFNYDIFVPSMINQIQKGNIENYAFDCVGAFWVGATTFATLDGFYDLYRGKHHHELLGRILGYYRK